MLAKMFRREAARLVAFGRAAPAGSCAVEPLEPRQFLSATLKVENLDVLPGYERMIFNKIATPNPTIPNYVKDRGSLRLTNTGNTALTLSGATFSGPFKLLGTLPSSIPAGKSATVSVQFIATKVPAFTYNQTSFYKKPYDGGTYVGSLTFRTNDPAQPTYKEELAGYFQNKSEDNQEPGLQTIVNLVSNFKTNLGPPRTVTLSQGTTAKYYGEEAVSAYWQLVNPAKGVGVRQLASFHTQGDEVNLGWFKKSDKVYKHLYTTSGIAGQSLLPYKDGQPGVPANGSFSPGAGVTFGFKIDNEWSDDKLNKKKTGGGHHVRFFPARDHFGNKLANTYFMVMDYSAGMAMQNWDFQDNVYIVTNVKPAGN